MDRDLLVDLLAEAEQQIALANKQIAEQYRVIAKLEAEGHDTTAAVDLLRQFIDKLELYEHTRDQLTGKLVFAS
jgi:hypothetical protein